MTTTKLLEKVLDKFAIMQYNPRTKNNDFKGWKQMREIYTGDSGHAGWTVYLNDIEKVTKLAIEEAYSEGKKQYDLSTEARIIKVYGDGKKDGRAEVFKELEKIGTIEYDEGKPTQMIEGKLLYKPDELFDDGKRVFPLKDYLALKSKMGIK